ncbi:MULTISPECIES: hypothetical protein [Variovorax]|jgi:hypothetical protein|uniref:hypothetical protein n=1 Tax=Variovorax TaxID=34072 RepID=UPI00086A4AAF|nr:MULTISPECIES: hypothetical protein [Variovorax]ODU12299.1 MAG: hypothetical protein ABS94_31300 [Variovorax sp. SCN 67-85]ODV16802.1 MAG: hypothetical protein ABT25_30680 [Variovorax sp. SCN 67-20]OJZ04466.1 MAG: hypothetical protein BGP22_06355 [Variovorax sp. 67-131]UKI07700.1 hypothetical protein L3V85_33740 [Variovorax paradoxus]
MPAKIVDFSARSKVIRDEPFNVHFWQCTPAEFRAYLGRPRDFLHKLGIVVPGDCRIETTIENHDWLEHEAPEFASEGGNDTVICNMGSGAATRSVYRVVSYARDQASTGDVEKALLHRANRQQVKDAKPSPGRKGKAKGKKAKRARRAAKPHRESGEQ